MSRRNNVNPDHYKVAGRQRQGEQVVHEVERRRARLTGRDDKRVGAKPVPAGKSSRRRSQREPAARRLD